MAKASSGDPVVIVGAARTAIGGFQGAFASVPAPVLGAAAIKAAVGRAGIDANTVSKSEIFRILRKAASYGRSACRST